MPRVRTLSARWAWNVSDFGAGAEDALGSFEALWRALLPARCPWSDRAADLGDITVGVADYRLDRNLVLLHVVSFTPGEGIEVVPGGGQRPIHVAPPPPGTDYLDGDMMLLVRGNDVILCGSGLSEGNFGRLVEALAQRRHIGTDLARAVLTKRVQVDRLAEIERAGVKSITMDAVAGQLAVDDVERRSVRRRLLGPLSEELRNLLDLDGGVPDDAENLKVAVTLSFDRRRRGAVTAESLQDLAGRVLQDAEGQGFSIVTMDNQTIRPDEVTISRPVEMEGFGKSVRHEEAWRHMRVFDRELRARHDGDEG